MERTTYSAALPPGAYKAWISTLTESPADWPAGDGVYRLRQGEIVARGLGPFDSMVGSLSRLTAQQAAAIRPRVIDVVTVRAGDTVQSLANRMAYSDYKLERFLTLNSLEANSRLQPGQKVKLVVYGSRG